MKRTLAFYFLWTACLPVLAQVPALHQRDTLLYVHFLQDGSLGEIQILSSSGEDAFAVCEARKLFGSAARKRHASHVDHWEKVAIVTGEADHNSCTP